MPGVATVIEAVVAPLLHTNAPVTFPAVSVELPQLFTTVTVGAGTAEVLGTATPEPAALLHPFTICVTV